MIIIRRRVVDETLLTTCSETTH